ncbi:hypothetical protein [Pseudomonas sp. Pseusp97]|uniref:hypothetical protein n=1 Tax=Pseudomonas sp. Pseusp97 TaxID=3243065 RepID=UPI0039A5EE00
MLDWLKSWLNDIVKWIADFAEWIPRKLFSVIMGQVAEFINAIPVPDFVLQAKAAAGNFPASVL